MRNYVWKKGTATQFKEQNPLLDSGVIAYEKDTKYFKYGDGINHYNDLPYINKPKSAYDLAVDNGFEGTEQEWLESLKGTSAYEEAKKLGYTGTADEYYSGTVTGISKFSWGNF